MGAPPPVEVTVTGAPNPSLVADPQHPGFYTITGGALTPDGAHPGFYLIGA